MRPFACLLLLATSALAKPGDDFRPDFSTLTPPEHAMFLQSICPGHGTVSGCDACPPGTSFPQDSWNLETVIFGHFRSATSDDALLSGSGCEPHVVGQGGSYMFTRQASQWIKSWYSPGYPLALCKKLHADDGRDRLICEQSDMHQGVADTFLFLLDPGQEPKPGVDSGPQIFLGFNDSLGSCVKLPDGTVVTGQIAAVDFTSPQTQQAGVRISVKLLLGKAAIPDSVLAAECDGKGRTPVVTTVPRSYQFLFDGKEIVPAGTNPKTEAGWSIPPQTSYRAR